MRSLLYYLNLCSLLCVFMFFTHCEKKVVNQKEPLSNGTSLSHPTLDQAYNEFMWLEFEKLTNRQLLNKMKLLFMMPVLLEFNSLIDISINDPGDIFKSTFVDLIFVTRFISQSIFL